MTYYHGTSIVGLQQILPPAETGYLREGFRQGYRDCVFITPLRKSAEMYAKKCATKFGGTPIVYEVEPSNPININVAQYICDKALVLSSYKVV